MNEGIRVIVADDSPTARRYLVDLLNGHPGVTVVGEAADGQEAVELTAQRRPSIVVMDAVMPQLDGFAATERIMTDTPTPVLVVTAALDPRDVALAMRSVEVGALAVAPKPVWPRSANDRRQADAFARKVVTLSGVRVIRRRVTAARRQDRRAVVSPARERMAARQVDLIAIAASTGGPQALHRLLRHVPAPLPVPVLIVQHIAEGFVNGFARWLADSTAHDVKVAVDGERLHASVVYVAPDGYHLTVASNGSVELTDGPRVEGFRPAANVLFESVATVHGEAGVGVVLSGLGEDGLAGLFSVHATGGCVLAQDESSSVVSSMPAAVIRAGIADSVGPPEDLASCIVELCGGEAP